MSSRLSSGPRDLVLEAFDPGPSITAGLEVLEAAGVPFASWESHGELMDQEALKQKATSQELWERSHGTSPNEDRHRDATRPKES